MARLGESKALRAVVVRSLEPVLSNVSVIVVSYNTRDQLRRCLSCIEPEHEVIVIDNASTDGSAEMVREEFSGVRLVVNPVNRGFGAANNQGLEMARRDLVLFLNSDCYAEPGAIDLLANVLLDQDREYRVAAGGRLLNLDGSNQVSTAERLTLWAVFCEQSWLEKLLPGTVFDAYWNTKTLLREYDARIPITQSIIDNGRDDVTDEHRQAHHRLRSEVAREFVCLTPQVMGACLMMRPLEKFDERFFLYCEDTDLCLRLRRHGAIVYAPAARFFHELGASSTGSGRWLSVARYNRGKELYFAIHHGSFQSALCWLFNRMGALLRLTLYSLAAALTLGTKFRDRVALWWRVLTAPALGPDRR